MFISRWINTSYFCFSSVHISRKSWHTLLNTCFHIAMTTAIYAGGISLNSYPVVCQAVSKMITHSHFITLISGMCSWVSFDCNATGGHCPALLVTLNPAVDWNQCQGDLQRGCVATATTDRRGSSFASTAAYAQVSEPRSLTLTLHTMGFTF